MVDFPPPGDMVAAVQRRNPNNKSVATGSKEGADADAFADNRSVDSNHTAAAPSGGATTQPPGWLCFVVALVVASSSVHFKQFLTSLVRNLNFVCLNSRSNGLGLLAVVAATTTHWLSVVFLVASGGSLANISGIQNTNFRCCKISGRKSCSEKCSQGKEVIPLDLFAATVGEEIDDGRDVIFENISKKYHTKLDRCCSR